MKRRVFRHVYREHHRFVWRCLRRLGVARVDADDAMQDVFVVVHRRLPGFEERAPIEGWLFQIARRVATNYRRRRGTEHRRYTELLDVGVHPNPEDALFQQQALALLDLWLDELKEGHRAVFVLSALEQMQGHEIAEALGLNVNTVHARIRSARTHLRRRARRMDNIERWPRAVTLHRSDEPRPAAVRRVHAAILAKVGIGAGVWKAAIVIVMLGTGAAVVAQGNADEPPPTEHVGRASPPARSPPPSPRVSETTELAETTEPVETTEPSAPLASSVTSVDRSASYTSVPARSVGVPPSPPVVSPEPVPARTDADLVDEMRRLRAMRALAKRGDRPALAEAARAYHQVHPQGTLRAEVRELEIFSRPPAADAMSGHESGHENDRDSDR